MRAVVVRLWYCIPVHVRHNLAQIYWGCTIEITNPFVYPLSAKACLCTNSICQGFDRQNCAGQVSKRVPHFSAGGQCQRFARSDGQVLRLQVLILGAGYDITPRSERYPLWRDTRCIVKISSARLATQPIPLVPNPVIYLWAGCVRPHATQAPR